MRVASLGIQIYPQSTSRPDSEPAVTRMSPAPALQFGSLVNDQALLGWIDQAQASFQQGPVRLVRTQRGPQHNQHQFYFQFCGEDDEYSLNIYLHNDYKTIVAANLSKVAGTPEGQGWSGITLHYDGTVWREDPARYQTERPNTTFSRNGFVIPSTESFSPAIHTKAHELLRPLLQELQQAQLHMPKDTLALEYNHILARYKIAMEDSNLGHLSLQDKEKANERYDQEMEKWESFIGPIAKRERKNQREMREEIEALATKQMTEHHKLAAAPSIWQRLSSLAKDKRLVFTPVA